MKQRYDYIDNIKVALTCLVIFHHIAITFGGEGAFIVFSKTKGSEIFNLVMTGILAINQSYFMGLFFFISAIFSYKSLARKGSKVFIKGKIRRLLLPVLVYLLFVNPLIIAIRDLVYYGKATSELTYQIGIGPLWFLLALFLFDLTYALLYKRIEAKGKTFQLNLKKIVFIVLIGTLITWIIRIVFPVGAFIPVLAFQPAHFTQYIIAYILGVQISKNNLLEKLKEKNYGKVLFLILPVLGLLIFVVGYIVTNVGDIMYAFGGANIFSLLYSLYDMLMFIIMGIGLFGLFYRDFNKKGKILNFMSQNAFGAYIFHSLGIVLVLILVSPLNLNHYLAFCFVTVLAIFVSFLGGRLIRRLK